MDKMTNKNSLDDKLNRYSFGNITMLIFNQLLLILNVFCYCSLIKDQLGTLSFVAIAASCVLFGLSFLFFFKRWDGWLKVNFVIVIIITLFTWGYYLFVVFDLLKYINNPEDMRALIDSAGVWSYLVYVLVQFLQVTFIPIPAVVTTLAGTVLFGPGIATLLSFAGILLGSLTAFIIGDKLGEKVVRWIVGEKNVQKYGSMLYDKGKYMFFLMMLFPVFPDDVLCLIAGMTTMSYRFFITTILLTRPIGIAMTCYLGGGYVIPYTEVWGLIVWGVIILAIVAAFWLSYRYKDKIEVLVNKFAIKFKDFFTKLGNSIKRICQDFIALFSKSYKAKLLLKRNKLPYLLLNEGVGDDTEQKN